MDTQSNYSGYRSVPLRQRSTTLYSSTLSASPLAGERTWRSSWLDDEQEEAPERERGYAPMRRAPERERSTSWERSSSIESTPLRQRREYVSAYLDESSVVRVTRRSQRGNDYGAWGGADERAAGNDRDDFDERESAGFERRRTVGASASSGLRQRLSNGWRVFSRQDSDDEAADDYVADEAYDVEPYGFSAYGYDDDIDSGSDDYSDYPEEDYGQIDWRSRVKRRSYIEDYSSSHRGTDLLSNLRSAGEGLTSMVSGAAAHVGGARILRCLLVVATLAWCLGMLYTPLRNCYIANRQLNALQSSYDRVNEENDQIRSELAYLQTHEGIEDVARTRGYVEPGDTKVIVEGVQDTGYDPAQPYTPTEEKIVEERTWYIEMLDNLFGYNPEA